VGNPLAGILGYLSLIKSKKPSTIELDEWVGHIEQEVLRIHQILKSLLLMGRPVKGQIEPVDLHSVMDSCLRLLVTGPDFREVQIEVSVPSGTMVLAEAGPLTQVLLNLFLNSAQAMGGKGQIRLQSGLESDWVNLTVTDTGPGLSMQAREHLFEPFFTTKPEGKGTGVGLVVSRHLMRAMGGDLLPVFSEGIGACFLVKLPAIRIDSDGLSKTLVT
jgi:signal transduction histidine kinase